MALGPLNKDEGEVEEPIVVEAVEVVEVMVVVAADEEEAEEDDARGAVLDVMAVDEDEMADDDEVVGEAEEAAEVDVAAADDVVGLALPAELTFEVAVADVVAEGVVVEGAGLEEETLGPLDEDEGEEEETIVVEAAEVVEVALMEGREEVVEVAVGRADEEEETVAVVEMAE